VRNEKGGEREVVEAQVEPRRAVYLHASDDDVNKYRTSNPPPPSPSSPLSTTSDQLETTRSRTDARTYAPGNTRIGDPPLPSTKTMPWRFVVISFTADSA
jgi:hypothetical protein